MLNEEKVIAMTRMASYEEGKGKEHLRICSYFRSDYIGAAILKAAGAVTITFVFVIALYIYYNFEDFMENIYQMDMIGLFKTFGKYYLICLIVYVVISYLVAFIKYFIARRNIRKYKNNLKMIRKLQKDK
jgi:flagellar biosynthesis protein FlhB